MIKMNKNFWYILLIGFLFVLCCVGLMQSVGAYDRVPQGGTVYLNDTLDISGVAAGYSSLVYVNEWEDVLSPDNSTVTYIIPMPQQKELYYNFSIDPDIFSTRLGWWWHYSGMQHLSANDRAFFVAANRPPLNETVGNGTFKNMTQVWVPKPLVPERHVADYLIARGDPLNLTFTVNKSTCWIFGRLDGIYNRPVVNQNVSFTGTELGAFEPGTYTIMFHSVGNDLNFDVRIRDNKLEYFDSSNFHVYSLDLAGMTPKIVMDKILSVRGTSDDTFTMKTLEIQNPSLDIIQIDALDITDTTAVWQIRGYTNLENGSELMFVLDKDKTLTHDITDIIRRQNSWNSTVLSYSDPGSMRYFDYGVPIDYNMMAPGPHEVTVYGAHHTEMTVTKFVYESPIEFYKPNQTTKYAAGNLFVPTPTPEIIIQHDVVQGPKEYVTIEVPVTPSDEQVHSEQMKVQWEFWTTVAEWACIVIMIVALIGYGFLVWRRLK